ncbi:hypothetical protein GCM10027162_61180 [Streptomyces incanus]
MARNTTRTLAATALCTVAGAGLVGCDSGVPGPEPTPAADASAREAGKDLFTGTKKITVEDRSVNVSCSGKQVEGRPTVVLPHGGGRRPDQAGCPAEEAERRRPGLLLRPARRGRRRQAGRTPGLRHHRKDPDRGARQGRRGRSGRPGRALDGRA